MESFRIDLRIHRKVAKTFGIEIDKDTKKPLRDSNGQIRTTKPKVHPNAQKKFVEFLDAIELNGKIDPDELYRLGFEVIPLEEDPYFEWASRIVRDFYFKIRHVNINEDDFVLARAKLNQKYRVTYSVVRDRSVMIIYVLIVDGGKREGYYNKK
ncbi:hypothetical protein E3E35_08010 [Thermococcus sp. GR7]|uniref:hypothetical protein n=1 Tax=unclassified Thermococcus TaxID=2627626 RepID=UPI001432282B|nr:MULTISPECIES: hypothetical protein [unclassified Thermococcus]NJE47343.1 hypothetical protein [Thermococcus sp. GR7]NJE79454.1 hypothetical protein [Thermococcus sp. GR4]NJF23167.1 hypothetical protein [Thermococcus sp. GR5]